MYDLLGEPGTADAVTRDLRYVIVDEYQDTNYIQEQLLLKLTERSRNLCVVGDEDQSLYRFRGATVRNILEFPQRMPGCEVVKLTTNYRSHRAIVERNDHWMASADWSNLRGAPFRYDKTIEADASGVHPDYPAVIAIWGRDRRDEAGRFADLVAFLKRNDVIADYGQVALLLHSVREEHSGPYLGALEANGIPAFCPRARTYFEIPEVRDLVACFAVLFGWHGSGRGQVAGAVAELAEYVDNALIQLGRRFGTRILSPPPCNAGPAKSPRSRKARRSTYARPTTSTTCWRSSRSRALFATRTPRAISRSSHSSSTSSRATTTTPSSHIEAASFFASTSSTASCACSTTAASTSTKTRISLSPRATCK